jgi:outer membrane protein TolC
MDTKSSETSSQSTHGQAEVQPLTRARDLSQEAYRAGSIKLTDVLDADRELLTAQDQLDANRADAARAAVAVFRSFGVVGSHRISFFAHI